MDLTYDVNLELFVKP